MGAGRRAAKAIHEDLMKETDETLRPPGAETKEGEE